MNSNQRLREGTQDTKPRKQHGGARKGAGRKPEGATARARNVTVILTEEEYKTVVAAIMAENARRAARGQGLPGRSKPVSISSWFREKGLAGITAIVPKEIQ